jgi:hypothetical protein
MPAANTAVELKPECTSDATEGTAGSLSCTGKAQNLGVMVDVVLAAVCLQLWQRLVERVQEALFR